MADLVRKVVIDHEPTEKELKQMKDAFYDTRAMSWRESMRAVYRVIANSGEALE